MIENVFDSKLIQFQSMKCLDDSQPNRDLKENKNRCILPLKVLRLLLSFLSDLLSSSPLLLFNQCSINRAINVSANFLFVTLPPPPPRSQQSFAILVITKSPLNFFLIFCSNSLPLFLKTCRRQSGLPSGHTFPLSHVIGVPLASPAQRCGIITPPKNYFLWFLLSPPLLPQPPHSHHHHLLLSKRKWPTR